MIRKPLPGITRTRRAGLTGRERGGERRAPVHGTRPGSGYGRPANSSRILTPSAAAIAKTLSSDKVRRPASTLR